jgi:hypothetical protein
MGEKRRSGEVFVLAALLGLAAVQLWLIATIDASFALASCSNGFSVFADSAQCRWPAIEVAIGWVLFTGALASGWIGGVRVFNNRVLAGAQRKAGHQAAAVAGQQLQGAAMGARHPLHDS